MSSDSVWVITDEDGSLARIAPDTETVRVWVTRADAAEITAVDAATGAVLGTTKTGPG